MFACDFFEGGKNLATASLLNPLSLAAEVASGVLNEISGFLFKKSLNQAVPAAFFSFENL